MKRYLIALAASLCVMLAALASYNWRHDALGVLNTDFSVRRYGVAQRFVKMRYLHDHPQKYNAFSFGSSRVAKVPVTEIDDGCRWYNLTYGSGLPREWLEDLQMLLDNGTQVEKVLIALDDFSFRADPDVNAKNGGSFLRYRPHDAELYLQTLFRRPDPPPTKSFLEEKGIYFDIYETGYTTYPWVDEAIDQDPEKHRQDPVMQTVAVRDDERIDATIDELQQIVDLCKAHNIELAVIINPLYRWTYLANDQASFDAFKRRLADITDYYDFSGVNDVTIDEMNYYETSHYRPQVGRRILARIYGSAAAGPEEFGTYVTRENVDAHLVALTARRDAYLVAHGEAYHRALFASRFAPWLPEELRGTPDAAPLAVHLDSVCGSSDLAQISWTHGQGFQLAGWQGGEDLVAVAALLVPEDGGMPCALAAKLSKNPGACQLLGLSQDAMIGIEASSAEAGIPAGIWHLRIRARTADGRLVESGDLATVVAK